MRPLSLAIYRDVYSDRSRGIHGDAASSAGTFDVDSIFLDKHDRRLAPFASVGQLSSRTVPSTRYTVHVEPGSLGEVDSSPPLPFPAMRETTR